MKYYNDSKKIVKGLQVRVDYDNVEKALRKLRKMVDEDGRIKEYRDRVEFQKNSEKKQVNRKRAIKRNEKRLKNEQLKRADY